METRLKADVYQNCLEQSQRHVCNSAYDHYNYMETRLKAGIHISRKDGKHIYKNMLYKLYRYGLCGLFIVVMIPSVDFPQEIFAIDMLRALKSPLEHHCKHIVRAYF